MWFYCPMHKSPFGCIRYYFPVCPSLYLHYIKIACKQHRNVRVQQSCMTAMFCCQCPRSVGGYLQCLNLLKLFTTNAYRVRHTYFSFHNKSSIVQNQGRSIGLTWHPSFIWWLLQEDSNKNCINLHTIQSHNCTSPHTIHSQM